MAGKRKDEEDEPRVDGQEHSTEDPSEPAGTAQEQPGQDEHSGPEQERGNTDDGEKKPEAEAQDGPDNSPEQEGGSGDGEGPSASADVRKLRAENKSLREKLKAAQEANGDHESRAASADERLAEMTRKLHGAQLREAASGRLADPEDAELHLADTSEFVGDDGALDVPALHKALDELLKRKPYLAAAKRSGFPPHRSTPSAGATSRGAKADFQDFITRRQ